eukprot:scaffold3053_cov204-Alexandrium_tamarense.AAC.15
MGQGNFNLPTKELCMDPSIKSSQPIHRNTTVYTRASSHVEILESPRDIPPQTTSRPGLVGGPLTSVDTVGVLPLVGDMVLSFERMTTKEGGVVVMGVARGVGGEVVARGVARRVGGEVVVARGVVREVGDAVVAMGVARGVGLLVVLPMVG